MTVDVEAVAPTVLLATATVRRTERISPSFVRVTLESPDFVDLNCEAGFDTRFKLVFPGPSGALPEIPENPEQWYDAWSAMPEDERAPMRTYTIRDTLVEDGQTVLVVDLVVHDEEHGQLGPACRWALAAGPGDVLQVIAPHRRSQDWGGTEFDPGDRRELLLAADETAVPAVARILADLAPGFTGQAFLEVPTAADILDLPAPPGIQVTWLPRDGRAEHGRTLVSEVRRALGLGELDGVLPTVSTDLDVEVWETPTYSSAGEDVESQLAIRSLGSDLDGVYAWIAGESWCVKALRRSLVQELHVDRGRVAFMGYWREGVAMKS